MTTRTSRYAVAAATSRLIDPANVAVQRSRI